MTLSEQYARFVSELAWPRLPAEVRLIALELFADWFANAAAGLASPLSQAFLFLAPIYDGPGRALRVGDLKPVEPLWAALVNASASHALEFDDSYRAGLYHPGAPILGIKGVGIICHGKSSARAIKNAILMAVNFVNNRVQERLSLKMARFHA